MGGKGRFQAAACLKEMHGTPVYGVTWSTDIYKKVERSKEETIEMTTEKASLRTDSSGTTDRSSDSNAVYKTERDSATTSPAGRQEAEVQQKECLMRCFATCGSNHVTVYETECKNPAITMNTACEASDGALAIRQAYVDPDEEEIFYVCAFGGRSLGSVIGYGPRKVSKPGKNTTEHVRKSKRQKTDVASPTNPIKLSEQPDEQQELLKSMTDLSKYDGPQLLCVAGMRGIVKVIDTTRKMLLMTLSGHGDEIYDMKVNPVKEWLLLTASKDLSIRLWNMQSATCVASFHGHEAHRLTVLSIGWHPLGEKFVSSSMDRTIKIWSIADGTEVGEALKESAHVRPRNVKKVDGTKPFRMVVEQIPIFSSDKAHLDYVDCVQFVGDLVLSKSTGNAILLWKPDLVTRERGAAANSHQRLPSHIIGLKEFLMNNCNIWYIRFATDRESQKLAVGNTIGELKVWEIGGSLLFPHRRHFSSLTHPNCTATVRTVAFSPDGDSIVATCDDATVWKWDCS